MLFERNVVEEESSRSARNTWGRLMGAASLMVLAAAGDACAQAADSSVPLDEVVVTAQRREQRAQDVGVALTVVRGRDLDEKNVRTVTDLENVTPNLEVDQAYGGGQPQFRIRGVGFKDYSANNASTVGVYVDDVAFPFVVASTGLLFDLDRIEVLRGPQGTLYGRNTTGGAVNIITAAPTPTFSAGASAEYGRFDAFKAEGYVSGPIAKDLTGRLAVATEQGGAWQKNRDTGESLGDADRVGVRGKLRWTGVEGWRFDLNGHWTQDKSDGLGLQLVSPFATRAGKGVTIPADHDIRSAGWGEVSPAFAAASGAREGADPYLDNHGWGVDLTARGDLGAVQLTSVTGYEGFKRREYEDWDASASHEADTYWHNNGYSLSQEVRLSNTTKGPLNWVAGVYAAADKINGGFYSDFSDIYNFITDTHYSQKSKDIGVFGQADYALTNKLRLVGGLRYEYEKRSIHDFYTAISGIPTSAPFSDSTDMSQVTGKVGLEYRPIDHVLLYANASRGVKSGGFTTYNKSSTSDDQVKPFKPEKLWAYEVGFKTSLPSQRLTLNGAAYYYDYRDQQVQASVVSEQYGVIGKLVNAPKSQLWGGELELEWEPIRNLQISQALGYKRGEYKDFSSVNNSATRAANPAGGPYTVVIYSDRDGEALPIPRIDYTGSAAYTLPVGGYDIRAETNYVHRSDLYSTSTSSVVKGYWVFNANLTLHPRDGRWTAGLWGRNIFDKRYEETRNQFTTAATASVHEPATYGVRLSYSY